MKRHLMMIWLAWAALHLACASAAQTPPEVGSSQARSVTEFVPVSAILAAPRQGSTFVSEHRCKAGVALAADGLGCVVFLEGRAWVARWSSVGPVPWSVWSPRPGDGIGCIKWIAPSAVRGSGYSVWDGRRLSLLDGADMRPVSRISVGERDEGVLAEGSLFLPSCVLGSRGCVRFDEGKLTACRVADSDVLDAAVCDANGGLVVLLDETAGIGAPRTRSVVRFAADGSVRWGVPADWVEAIDCAMDGAAVFCCGTNSVVALDTQSGKIQREWVPRGFWRGVAVAGDGVVLSSDSRLVRLQLSSACIEEIKLPGQLDFPEQGEILDLHVAAAGGGTLLVVSWLQDGVRNAEPYDIRPLVERVVVGSLGRPLRIR